MTLKRILLASITSLLLISCQKGVDWATTTTSTGSGTGSGGNGGGTTGDLLVKLVAVTGTDTFTVLYTYDASKRLLTEDSKGTSGGMTIDIYQKFYRDANGRIYKISQLMKQPGMPSDTSFTNVYYPDATTLNFTYKTTDMSMMGLTTHDSTVYAWNASGNVTVANSFMTSALLPGSVTMQKYEYTYSNGNLTQQKSYSDINTTGTPSLVATYNYTFDNNTNPIIANGEFLLTGKTETASKNNVVKMEIVDATTPSNSRTMTTSITYGTDGKPTKGTVTMQPQGMVTKYTFFYQ
jgi:hypothetical protein